jgi:hypothetical protein
MITPTLLADYFARNVQILKMQAEGLSQTDSLVQLPFRANCLNWVVGHLVTNRLSVVKLLDAQPPFDAARMARYARESEPVTVDGLGVLPLEELIGLLEELQAQIAALLADISPEALAHEIVFFGSRQRPVSEWLFFFYFHDTYHVGQAEILRQAAGKDDKII